MTFFLGELLPPGFAYNIIKEKHLGVLLPVGYLGEQLPFSTLGLLLPSATFAVIFQHKSNMI